MVFWPFYIFTLYPFNANKCNFSDSIYGLWIYVRRSDRFSSVYDFDLCMNGIILTRGFSFQCNCWEWDPLFHPVRLYTSSYHLPYSESRKKFHKLVQMKQYNIVKSFIDSQPIMQIRRHSCKLWYLAGIIKLAWQNTIESGFSFVGGMWSH